MQILSLKPDLIHEITANGDSLILYLVAMSKSLNEFSIRKALLSWL